MQQPRLTGPGAGSDKYDLLTALSVTALAAGGQQQITLLRLMALLTARYNWAQDELSLGQREMAQMWSVDERTVKREIKRLTESGLLLILRPGVKGRVALYRLNMHRLREVTADYWTRVGTDFESRMSARHQPAPDPVQKTVVQVDFAARQKPAVPVAEGRWALVLDRLHHADPARTLAWFRQLTLISDSDGELILRAPSRFAVQYIETHLKAALISAVRLEYGPSGRVQLCSDA